MAAPFIEIGFASSSPPSSVGGLISTNTYALLSARTLLAFSRDPSFKNFLSVEAFSTKSSVFYLFSSLSYLSFSSIQSFTLPLYCSILTLRASICSLTSF
jgi:hypothetical protein